MATGARVSGGAGSGATQRVIVGDCRAVMAGMEAASIDAIVTDPPYGLEFMGKDWDKLDAGLPQENVWKGRRGKGGGGIAPMTHKGGTFKDFKAAPSYGGKRAGFKRCANCGKRAFSGSPCRCNEPEWVIEYPEGAPSSVIRMQRWHETWLREAFRVLKPGGVLLAFGGTRTWHRLACAIEDAGFVLFDTLMWLHGQGFPKHKTLLKPSFEPILCAKKPGAGGLRTEAGRLDSPVLESDKRLSRADSNSRTVEYAGGWAGNNPGDHPESVRHNAAGRWPSNVCLSHVPPDEHGEGGCVPVGMRRVKGDARSGQAKGSGGLFLERAVPYDGRPAGPLYGDPDGTEAVVAWACHPSCPVAELDRQSGERTSNSGTPFRRNVGNQYSGGFSGDQNAPGFYGDTGGASRYFATFGWETSVDLSDSSDDNSGNKEDSPCFDNANTVVASSTPSPTTCVEGSGGSALGNAGAPGSASGARPTPGATSARVTGDGTGSGGSPAAASSINNSKAGGSGSRQTALFPPDTKSTTETRIRETTIPETSNASPSVGTTTTTSGSERTTAPLTASKNGDANDAASTSRLPSSTAAPPEPGRATASHANSTTTEPGMPPVEGAPTDDSAKTCAWEAGEAEAAARFFYAPKADRAERDRGLAGMPKKFAPTMGNGIGVREHDPDDDRSYARNHHPCVKPLALMQWLVRLAASPGDTILDPFLGSGTTLIACDREGVNGVGIEQDAEYARIAELRIRGDAPLFANVTIG